MKYSTILLLLLLLHQHVPAYETKTHAVISSNAIKSSMLANDPQFFTELGLDIDAETQYLPGVVPLDPDGNQPDEKILLDKLSVLRLVSGGAVLEDAGARSVHHFMDPQNGNVAGSAGLPSADWILESVIHPEDGHETGVSFGNQQFSYRDALNYFYLAQTSPEVASRLTNYGLMFRSLGHVIHHLQDMAQPQHVRNDAHCNAFTDFPGPAFLCFILGKHNPSYYEEYTNERVDFLPVQNESIDVPMFARAREYWVNLEGSGIADYTGRNFVSDGTNYTADMDMKLTHHPDLPMPVPLPETVSMPLPTLLETDPFMTESERQSLFVKLGCGIYPDAGCLVDFVQNSLPAAEGHTITNTRSSTVSVFDEELRKRNIVITNTFLSTYASSRMVALNRFNFEAVYRFLIPRAVAYSAGLINHFFRGRLNIDRVDWSSRNKLLVVVRNASGEGMSFAGGHFEVYLNSLSGLRKAVQEVNFSGGRIPLLAGESISLSVDIADESEVRGEHSMTLLYNGIDGFIGAEAGLATKQFNLPPVGRVSAVQNLDACPQRSISVTISFKEAPGVNGEVFLIGRDSGWSYDFTGVARGQLVTRDNIQGRYAYVGGYTSIA